MSQQAQMIKKKKRRALDYLNQNKLADAKQIYKKLLKHNAADAEAWFMLATVEGRVGNLSAAENNMRKALEVRPDLAQAWLGLGQSLELQVRYEEACDAYRNALKLNSDIPDLFVSLGRVYVLMSHHRKAQKFLEYALELGVKTPQLLSDYADVLCTIGKKEQGVSVYRQVFELDPDNVRAYFNLGCVLLGMGRYDEATQCFVDAQKAVPDFYDGAAGEAMVLRFQHRFDEAIEKINSLVDVAADNLWVVLEYAALCKRLDACAEARGYLERLLAQGRLNQAGETLANFSLGRLYDDNKEYDKAFACYKKANDCCRGGFDRPWFEKHINSLMDEFSHDYLKSAPYSDFDETPVFIIGMPRSGTSLLEQILASHPEVYGAGELMDVSAVVEEFVVESEPLNAATLNRMAESYLERTRKLAGGEKYITDKLPGNFLKLGLIALMFPQAKIIHAMRDPLDTCLSIYFNKFSGDHLYSYDLEDLGFYYRHYQRLMAHWSQVLSIPVLNVQYETMVANQEAETRRVLDFLGLGWDERCLEFYKSKRVVMTSSHDQVQNPVYNSSVRRWKNYESYLAPLIKALEI